MCELGSGLVRIMTNVHTSLIWEHCSIYPNAQAPPLVWKNIVEALEMCNIRLLLPVLEIGLCARPVMCRLKTDGCLGMPAGVRRTRTCLAQADRFLSQFLYQYVSRYKHFSNTFEFQFPCVMPDWFFLLMLLALMEPFCRQLLTTSCEDAILC